MKKIKFEKKLQLNKETIAHLNEQQLSNINGGAQFLSLWNCGIDTTKCETNNCTLTAGVTCGCDKRTNECSTSHCNY